MEKTTIVFALAISALLFSGGFKENNVAGMPGLAKYNFAGASSAFAGTWKGDEKCQGVGAPVAVIEIRVEGAEVVSIKGLYSSQGKVIGMISKNTLTIRPQVVNDPNFKNLKIEGTLTLGESSKTIVGSLIIMNNNVRDNCVVNYRK